MNKTIMAALVLFATAAHAQTPTYTTTPGLDRPANSQPQQVAGHEHVVYWNDSQQRNFSFDLQSLAEAGTITQWQPTRRVAAGHSHNHRTTRNADRP